MVTRPGVNRNSMALWVTSIHDGMASGRQFTKIGGGRPAFSSANIFSTWAAAFGVHGGGLVLTCRSWSVIFGFHTPLQSGSFARSAHSFAVGGGLMTVGGFLAPSGFCSGSAAVIAAAQMASASTTPAANRCRIDVVSGCWELFADYLKSAGQCKVKPIQRPKATTATQIVNDSPPAMRAAAGLPTLRCCMLRPVKA